MNRRTLLGAALALPAVAQAQPAWPARPVRLIVPYPPGGATDIIARLYAEHMSGTLGQPVVVENRPGASGNIGIDAVAKAAPDGYTIGAGTVSNFSINQYLYRNVPYDTERDLRPIALGWEFPNIAVVAPGKVQARTLAEFIAWARGKRGGVTYGSTGVGTTTHLSSAMMFSRLGIEAVHVPYRGAAQIQPALLSGDIDFAIDGVASYQALVEAGQMRALAVTSAERWPTVPEVPTMAEAGMPDFVVTVWGGFVAPAATPDAVVNRLSAAFKAVVDDPAGRDRFARVGARAIWTTPADAAARAARERPMWRETILHLRRAGGLTVSDRAAQGRLALVTGVSSGIGAAVAARLLRDGWRVVGVSRGAPALDDPGFGHRAADLSDPAGAAAVAEGLSPDAVVHAAGLLRTHPLGALDPGDGEAMWRLHVAAAERLADLLLPRMPDGGRMVLIGSRTASGAAGRSQYRRHQGGDAGARPVLGGGGGAARHHRERRRPGRHRHADAARPRPRGRATARAAHRPLHPAGGGGGAGRLPAVR